MARHAFTLAVPPVFAALQLDHLIQLINGFSPFGEERPALHRLKSRDN